MKPSGSNRKGFTLVEAIVVAVIIGILAAVGVPVLTNYLERAKNDTARSTCELIAAAISHNHNRGMDIAADTWADIGISNPSDGTWTYSFPILAAADNLYGSNYAVTASRVGGTATGTFKAFLDPPDWSVAN